MTSRAVMAERSTGFGILLCLSSMFVFASQDAITKVIVQDMAVRSL